jgi:hypothetical protein
VGATRGRRVQQQTAHGPKQGHARTSGLRCHPSACSFPTTASGSTDCAILLPDHCAIWLQIICTWSVVWEGEELEKSAAQPTNNACVPQTGWCGPPHASHYTHTLIVCLNTRVPCLLLTVSNTPLITHTTFAPQPNAQTVHSALPLPAQHTPRHAQQHGAVAAVGGEVPPQERG